MWKKILLLLFLTSGFYKNALAQQVKISGVVTDSLQVPLAFANILAFPLNSEKAPSFAITNENGMYELLLLIDNSYKIEVSYLGYSPYFYELVATANKTFNISLTPTVEILNEVELVYKIPVIIKEDIIRYNTDAFVNGQERKLKEVLNKLPGIEVDREGNVTALGQKISTILVENKPFINGNSKLAVNNIPANVVDQIELIDQYTEISLLKGLADSNKKAINIKLKKDKKEFVFGDISAGGGERKNHTAAANLFQYKPSSHLNLIANSNSINEPAFTFSDYLDFEGGSGRLINGYTSLNQKKSNLRQFLSLDQNTTARQNFAALSLRKEFSKGLDFSSYYIRSAEHSTQQSKAENSFLSQAIPFSEDRTMNATNNNNYSLGKMSVEIKKPRQSVIKGSLEYSDSKNARENNLISVSPFGNTNFNKTLDWGHFQIKPNLFITKKIGESHTLHLGTDLFYSEERQSSLFNSNNYFLKQYSNNEGLGVKSAQQLINGKTTSIDANFKDFWVLNSSNHLYSSIGISILNEHYGVRAENMDTGNLISAFGNELVFENKDIYAGVEYKLKLGVWTLKPSYYLHDFNWSVHQKNGITKSSTSIGLPALYIHGQINRMTTINFNYAQQTTFAAARQYSDAPLIQDFNSIQTGNPILNNQIDHKANLHYNMFNLNKGTIINSFINYSKKIESIKTALSTNGVNQEGAFVNIPYPDQSIGMSNSFRKRKKNYSYKLLNTQRFSVHEQQLENGRRTNKGFLNKIETSYTRKFSNTNALELGIIAQNNQYKAANFVSKFNSQSLYSQLDWTFFKDIFIKAHYSFEKYQPARAENSNYIHRGDFSLVYQKENSAWRFEIFGSNIFNNRYILDNSQTEIIISNTRNFVQDRIWMFKLNYNL